MLVKIGSGMIANLFLGDEFCRPSLLLASGVSNSAEVRNIEFDREVNIILDSISRYPTLHIIYFSSCSIYQARKTPYISHKLSIESIIQNTDSYSIFRLPQAVGPVRNSTLISYLVGCIISRKKIFIQKNAKRNLIGSQDIVRLTSKIVNSGEYSKNIINLSSNNYISVIDICIEISKILGINAIIEIIDDGDFYIIPNSDLRSFLSDDDILFDEGYWKIVLQVYVPLIANLYRD